MNIPYAATIYSNRTEPFRLAGYVVPPRDSTIFFKTLPSKVEVFNALLAAIRDGWIRVLSVNGQRGETLVDEPHIGRITIDRCRAGIRSPGTTN